MTLSLKWFDDANCLGSDPSWFVFDEHPTASVIGRQKTALAKAVCRRCDVETECLEWAVANGERGIWGGTTDDERRGRSARRRGRPATSTARCGTNYGYQRHFITGEPACDECRHAHNVYNTERKRQRHLNLVATA